MRIKRAEFFEIAFENGDVLAPGDGNPVEFLAKRMFTLGCDVGCLS